jgi:preprotein translocase subunit YajC
VESLGTFLPLILIGVIAYLLIFRPARNRQKQQRQLLAALTPGSQIMTTAGVFGTVITVDDDEITLEVAPGVVLRMVKAAVARVIEPELSDEGRNSAPDEGFGTSGPLSKDV